MWYPRLGGMLTVTILVATETALSLVFDPRSRDFPFAGLTMAIVPLWLVARLNRGRPEARRVAEAVFASLLVSAALFILCNEGFGNWQSIWVSADYAGLGFALYSPRAAATDVTAGMRAAFPSLSGTDTRDIEPVVVDAVPQPKSKSVFGAFTPAVTPRIERDK